ncbi:hypothetical protein RIF29_33087 [Crotalaria pallida]|uniref:Endonuclease/exonuclease/phosphatase domain-containing protein n=1 Tax=Crotalaria pallida TaxID=3830 RepID=A0AAN9E7Y3_CROPI
MSLQSWNCRGLGSPRAIRSLRKLLASERPNIVFLMETRKKVTELQVLRSLNNNSYNMYAVDCNGSGRSRSGGLALLWNNSMNVTVSLSSLNHVDFSASFPGSDASFFISCIYGHPESSEKYRTWRLLNSIKKRTDDPWLAIGDINQVLCPEDKVGGNAVDMSEVDAARSCLDRCNLNYVQWVGPRYTWCNRRKHPHTIEEHLDRAFTNSSWNQAWQNTLVTHLPRFGSDHCPILLEIMHDVSGANRRRKKKLYRFEQFWLRHEGCESVIQHSWIPGDDVLSNIANVGENLSEWSRATFGNIPKKIAKLKAKLSEIQAKPLTDDALEEEKTISKELDVLLLDEEQRWQQRSRADWLMYAIERHHEVGDAATAEAIAFRWTVVFRPRLMNSVADTLAKKALVAHKQLWLVDIPDFLRPFFVSDPTVDMPLV